MARTFVHISDLHIGRDARTDAAAAALCEALVVAAPDAVLLTGDVTHRGRRDELDAFERMFAPLRRRLVAVPGNHDRLGADAASDLMVGSRVQVASLRDLFLVRIDSTAPHNRHVIQSHGELSARDLAGVVDALDDAPSGAMVVLMLHHHVLPLPEDHLGERLATLLGWPHAAELSRGPALVESVRGRCDLVLHGHRHQAGEFVIGGPADRPLRVLNAGSSTELGRFRMVHHECGHVVAERWLDVPSQLGPPARAHRVRRDQRALAAA